jgi:hypothetical protein
MMAGLSPNPALQTLRSNGYRVQYIHHNDYFVTARGVLDFNYPEVRADSALAVFGTPIIDRMIGVSGDEAERGSNSEQMKVLLAHIKPPTSETGQPWFTFSHVALPAHSPTNKTWKELDGYSEIYKRRTIEANEHMSKMIAAIKERDPDAIIVLIGDHGSWRFRNIWGKGGDPNSIMDAAGTDPTVVTLDVFGIMVGQPMEILNSDATLHNIHALPTKGDRPGAAAVAIVIDAMTFASAWPSNRSSSPTRTPSRARPRGWLRQPGLWSSRRGSVGVQCEIDRAESARAS